MFMILLVIHHHFSNFMILIEYIHCAQVGGWGRWVMTVHQTPPHDEPVPLLPICQHFVFTSRTICFILPRNLPLTTNVIKRSCCLNQQNVSLPHILLTHNPTLWILNSLILTNTPYPPISFPCPTTHWCVHTYHTISQVTLFLFPPPPTFTHIQLYIITSSSFLIQYPFVSISPIVFVTSSTQSTIQPPPTCYTSFSLWLSLKEGPDLQHRLSVPPPQI